MFSNINHHPKQGAITNMEDTLFPLPPGEESQDPTGLGKPRVQRPNRGQMQWRAVDMESSLPGDHPARLIWDLVQQLDLSPWYAEIRAVEGQAGREAIDPAILMALWLFATLEGVGSARALDRLCREHDAYRWLCGGVSVNYHTLADFRVAHAEFLDQLLTQSVAAMLADGLVSLQRVAQDGKRVRASAGSGSFRRRAKLEQYLQEAQQQVAALRQELEADPQATSKRQQAARQRAVQERQERVQKALTRMAELEAEKQKQAKKANQKDRNRELRASTSDADARTMKMADGGYRPAYNVQFATDTQSQVIAGVEVTNHGSDRGELGPMQDQIETRYGCRAQEVLVDGGFVQLDDFEQVSQKHTTIYAPLPESRTPDRDPYQPQPGDRPSIAAWRQRMGTPQAKEIYKQRAATAECVNAIQHQRGLQSFQVRSLAKVKAVVLWFALLHNLMRGQALRLAAAHS
jgi:transposase